MCGGSAPQILPKRARSEASERARVAGQAIGQNAHVGRAARIRVVAQSHEAGLSAEARGDGNEIANGRALNARAEENDDVRTRLRAPLSAGPDLAWSARRIRHARRPASECAFASAPSGNLHGTSGLAMNFARAAVDHIELGVVMAHGGANLPGDQRILVA